MELTRATFETAEGKRSYLRGPENGPPLVWLHGVSGRALRWRDQLERFAPGFQVFALDARGHGQSERTPGRYRWLDHARDLEWFVRAVLDRPAVLVGHSLGALQAVRQAAEHPDSLAGIVLEDPPLYAAEHPEADSSQFRAMELAVRARMTADQILAVWPPAPGMSDSLRREYAEGMTELDPENLALTISLEAAQGFDVDADLSRIRCPALVLRAGASGVLSEAELTRALGRLARGAGVTIPGCGHQIHAEQPDRFAAELRTFLSRLN